ncbi:MAG: GGDEF domain-containing protein [[Eubacterium] siraeum]
MNYLLNFHHYGNVTAFRIGTQAERAVRICKEDRYALYHRSAHLALQPRGFFRIYNDYAEDGVKDDCMVISVDLDNLKLINDNFGHNEGDNAILTMANALKSAADENDICARFGGDEYVVFGKGKGEYEMNAYIDKVNKYLSEYNLTSKKPYNVHGSFGGCILPKGSKAPYRLLYK